MNLLELIAEFKTVTGRFDLTKAEIVRYLNKGQIYLDSRYSRESSKASYSVILPAYTKTFRVPHCLAVSKVGYRTLSTSDFTTVPRRTRKVDTMIQETGYGHFYGVTFNGTVLTIDNEVNDNNQGFLSSNFKIGQTLNLYSPGANGQLAFDSTMVDMPLGAPVITLVDKDQIQCDRAIPDAGSQCIIVGIVTTTEDVDYIQEYLEMTNAKRVNLFNLKSIVPSTFEGIVALNQPVLENTEIEVEYFYVEPLISDTDESWWSVNNDEILISAAAYKLEPFYRNTTARREWQTSIDEALVGLTNIDTKRKMHDTNRMNDSFTF